MILEVVMGFGSGFLSKSRGIVERYQISQDFGLGYFKFERVIMHPIKDFQ